jgi:hypothetical protein
VHPLGRDNHPRIALELPITRRWHPVGFKFLSVWGVIGNRFPALQAVECDQSLPLSLPLDKRRGSYAHPLMNLSYIGGANDIGRRVGSGRHQLRESFVTYLTARACAYLFFNPEDKFTQSH